MTQPYKDRLRQAALVHPPQPSVSVAVRALEWQQVKGHPTGEHWLATTSVGWCEVFAEPCFGKAYRMRGTGVFAGGSIGDIPDDLKREAERAFSKAILAALKEGDEYTTVVGESASTAAARAEIERLTHLLDLSKKNHRSGLGAHRESRSRD